MPHDNRVGFQVFHVDHATLAGHVRVLADHQPAHVREEKSPRRVVRIGVRVGELVVDSVVPDPFVYVVLERQCLEHGQQQSHRQTGGVTPVSPQPVGADRYAQTATRRHHIHCDETTMIIDNSNKNNSSNKNNLIFEVTSKHVVIYYNVNIFDSSIYKLELSLERRRLKSPRFYTSKNAIFDGLLHEDVKFISGGFFFV